MKCTLLHPCGSGIPPCHGEFAIRFRHRLRWNIGMVSRRSAWTAQTSEPYTHFATRDNRAKLPSSRWRRRHDSTALVTSGNSGLPRLNSSRKSSDIPLPTQSPIWVNPMQPITLSFGKKCNSVTTPGDNLQISSTKRAFIECMFLPRRLSSLHQGYFPDLIDQHDQRSVSTVIHVRGRIQD